MPLAQNNTHRRKADSVRQVRKILEQDSPDAAQTLCSMLEDETINGTARISVAKEILEHTVGKGQLADEKQEKPFELKLTVVDE